MKSLLFFVCLCLTMLISITVSSQCTVDAGDDRIICIDRAWNAPKLSGSVISGDIVSLQWEIDYYIVFLGDTIRYYASDILSDITVLDPVITSYLDRSHVFRLMGQTSNGETCEDSVRIYFSGWSFLTIDKITGKSPDDTITLWPSAGSEWPPFQYAWSPNYMINDTTLERPAVWNDTTIFYQLTITDSLGCSVMDQQFKVYVTPSSVISTDHPIFKIHPNPATDFISITGDVDFDRIELRTTEGKLIRQSSGKQIRIEDLNSGVYLLSIVTQDGSRTTSQIIVGEM